MNYNLITPFVCRMHTFWGSEIQLHAILIFDFCISPHYHLQILSGFFLKNNYTIALLLFLELNKKNKKNKTLYKIQNFSCAHPSPCLTAIQNTCWIENRMKNKGKGEDPDWKWKGEKMDILNEVVLTIV